MVLNNPWAVDNIDSFLKYCCPECNYQCQSRHRFVAHATKNHSKSHELLTEPKEDSKSALEDIKIECDLEYRGDDFDIGSPLDSKDVKSEDENGDNNGDIDNDPDYEPEDEEAIPTRPIIQVNYEYEVNERGWFTCHYCPSLNFLFDFELRAHMMSEHYEEVDSNNLTLRNREMVLDRDAKLAETGYTCFYCTDDDVKFEHKFELLTHWQDKHSIHNHKYEACQWCMEFFDEDTDLVSFLTLLF